MSGWAVRCRLACVRWFWMRIVVIANRWVHVYFTFFPDFWFSVFFIVQIFPHLLSPLRRLFHSSIRFCPVWRLIWIRVRCEVFPDKWNVFWTSFFYLFEFYLYCSTSCFVGNYEKREWKQKEKNLNRMPSAVNTHSVIFYVSLFIKWSTSLDSFVKYK